MDGSVDGSMDGSMGGERKGGREKEKEEGTEGKWMDGQMDGHRNLEGCCHPGYCPGKGRTTQAFVLEGSNLHFDVRFLQPLPAPPQSPVQPRGGFSNPAHLPPPGSRHDLPALRPRQARALCLCPRMLLSKYKYRSCQQAGKRWQQAEALKPALQNMG